MKFSILIIDNTTISKVIGNIYETIALDYSIIELTGEQVLHETYLSDPIDYILIDSENESYIFKLLNYFRHRWNYKHTPVLIVSEHGIKAFAEKFSSFGIVDFIHKPIDDFSLTYNLLYTYNLSCSLKTLKTENLILKKKLIKLEQLRVKNISLASSSQRLEDINYLLEESQSKIKIQQKELMLEKHKSEELLNNILPEEVSRELIINGEAQPQFYKKVTVMFTDFVGFTKVCEKREPQDMTKELDTHFSHFDDVCEIHYLEKIKTIGDAYMCAGGIPMRNNSNPFDVILAAMKMMSYMNTVNSEKTSLNQPVWQIRIGIHTGSVVAGVIGKRKFAYDIWGDAVNTAYRIESTSEPGRINISGDTYELVKDYFDCVYRGKIYAKNKGEIDMYFVERIKPNYSKDETGFTPNKEFNIAISKL
jgi:class 3 adenylate cyclase